MKAPLLLCFAGIGLLACCTASAQPAGCTLKDPVVHIDFGKGSGVKDFNTISLNNYDRITGSCPTDGHYTFTPATYDCFAGDWFTITQDHTPGDVEGNMMLVNASPAGGVFLQRPIKGLSGGRTYELAMWVINVCRLHICCSSLSPNISFNVASMSGKKLATFRIGDLPQRTSAQWRKFAGSFTMPEGESSVVLTLYNSTTGGCGNDFALDDITFRECVPIKPEVVVAQRKQPPVAAQTKPPAKKVAEKTETLKSPPNQSMAKAPAEKPPVRQQPVAIATAPASAPNINTSIPLPMVLRTRSNPLIRQIETGTGELVIDLYDNGQVDGDTVSVYHNNELVVSKARLSAAPIRLRIRVDAANPNHELVMVAHNLGTIPPNTSLMTVTAGEKRYQVNISSSEQQNAKVVFAWKE